MKYLIQELKTIGYSGEYFVKLESILTLLENFREKEESGRTHGGTISNIFCKDSQHPSADGIDLREKRSVYTGIYS